ncbi:MAG TPA: ATP-binding protein [Cytophagaceae bacterium]|nr:ATP-binding protein [Cytophagaceae bacterium]
MIPVADFQLLFEASPGLYLILLPDLTIAGANNAYLEATMTQRENIIGKNIFTVFPDNPGDNDANGVSNLHASLQQVLNTKTKHRMSVQKYDVQTPNGIFEERYWSPLNKPVLGTDGEIKYIIHRVEDITEFIQMQKEHKSSDNYKKGVLSRNQQMEMEVYMQSEKIGLANTALEMRVAEQKAELVASKNKYISTLDQMMEGIQIIGFDWRYIYINDAVVIQGALTKEELLGHTMMEIYPGIEDSVLFHTLEWCMKERKPIHLETQFTYPGISKESGWFQLSMQPVPEGILILSIDITERKNVEAQILQFNESLEQKVIERTEELKQANKIVLESNEQLLMVNKELNAFTYTVSHDLRSPLRAVDGYARMMEEDYHQALDQEGLRMLSMIQYNAKHMGTLIDDLLVFSRLGRKDIQKSTVNMNNLVEEILQELSHSGQEIPKINIYDLPPAQADYTLLKQVLVNLISNAIKYSSKNSNPEIEISFQQKDNETIYSVKDNGVGFEMQYVHKLFGIFQRLHSNEEFEGTGVGLAIVQRIIHKHRGRVWAEAAVGKGATFYFSLPI